jgi:hypothetical protein
MQIGEDATTAWSFPGNSIPKVLIPPMLWVALPLDRRSYSKCGGQFFTAASLYLASRRPVPVRTEEIERLSIAKGPAPHRRGNNRRKNVVCTLIKKS